MASHRRMIWYGRGLAGALTALLTAGCETAHMPLGVNPVAAPAPLPVTSLVGEPARLAWIATLSDQLQGLDHRINAGPAADPALLDQAARLRARIVRAIAAVSPADEDAGIIEFGTTVLLSTVGPGSVMAYTETSRATEIAHTIRIWETTAAGTYAHPVLTDDSGFFNQRSLWTTVGLSKCTEPMTVKARTNHSAGSLTFIRSYALSNAEGSCNPPPPPCPSDRNPPVSYDCTGTGGNGGTMTVTCYTVTTEYYWYYPDTDTYEYRYSETSTWCESST